MVERPSFDQVWLEVAKTIAQRGPCPRLQVGAVLVDKHNRIVSTGYNGAPSGVPHCTDESCLMEHNHCVRAIHAEVNALLQAGPKAEGATLYVTHKPCLRCTQLILAARIRGYQYMFEYP